MCSLSIAMTTMIKKGGMSAEKKERESRKQGAAGEREGRAINSAAKDQSSFI